MPGVVAVAGCDAVDTAPGIDFVESPLAVDGLDTLALLSVGVVVVADALEADVAAGLGLAVSACVSVVLAGLLVVVAVVASVDFESLLASVLALELLEVELEPELEPELEVEVEVELELDFEGELSLALLRLLCNAFVDVEGLVEEAADVT